MISDHGPIQTGKVKICLLTVATFWHTHKHTSYGIVLPAVATATRSAAPWQQAALTLISCTRVYDKIFSGSHDSPKDFFFPRRNLTVREEDSLTARLCLKTRSQLFGVSSEESHM